MIRQKRGASFFFTCALLWVSAGTIGDCSSSRSSSNKPTSLNTETGLVSSDQEDSAILEKKEKNAELVLSVREALKPTCGSCHQSSLPSSKPKALAVFDLDKEGEWYADMSTEQIMQLPGRVKNKFTEEMKLKVDEFVQCALKKNCIDP